MRMNNYLVIRTILFRRRGMVTMPIQLFDDKDGADDMVKSLDKEVSRYMKCKMVHPEDKDCIEISGNVFLGDLGIKAVEHAVITMPVKQSSLIKVPHLELIK
jgi:hypothetical protein